MSDEHPNDGNTTTEDNSAANDQPTPETTPSVDDNSQKNDATETSPEPYENREIAAEWNVPIRGKSHKIEFEHGTTSGKRIIWVNGKEVLRREWMFKLVGDDVFLVDSVRCVLRVEPAPAFRYKYILYVDGKPFKEFKEHQAKTLRVWETEANEKPYRVVLEKDTLNIYVNGELREEEGEFVDDGTETKWEDAGNVFILSARTSGNKREGLVHTLTLNGHLIEEVTLTDT